MVPYTCPISFFRRTFKTEAGHPPPPRCLVAVGLGVIGATAIIVIYTLTYYERRYNTAKRGFSGERNSPVPFAPEMTLPPLMLGAVVLPPALLWFGWSGNDQWASQIIACFFIGCPLQLIFTTGIVYIVDVYMGHTVSAISIYVMVRSLASATFPMFELPM